MVKAGKTGMVLVSLAALMLGGGCAGKKTPLPRAQTPQQAAKNMLQSMLNGEKEQFLSCISDGQSDRAIGGVMYEFGRAVVGFRDDFLKAYGEAAWRQFQSQEEGDAPKGANATLQVWGEEMLGKIDQAQVKIEGDKARLLVEGEEPLPLVKEQDEWRIQASALAQGSTPEKMAGLLGTMAETVRKYRKAIGKTGIKPDDIDYELGRALAKTMLGMEPSGPHRFDIDRL